MQFPYRGQRSQGLALVIVLAFLVLTSILIVGFFSTATTELSASKSYADGVAVRQLADTAVNVVMGQIHAATTEPNGAWTSQPGMLRVFKDESGASSNPYAFYKLYSSDKLILKGVDVSTYATSTEIPAGAQGWNHLPAIYTDINEPVQTVAPGSSNPENTLRYPVLDPTVGDTVEGFKLVTQGSKDDSNRPARMPVRWLYVLKDGTLTAPDSAEDNGRTAVWSKTDPQNPSETNPIVGRISFWTDDDSCKVNINTAGGFSPTGLPTDSAGSYWDTPRVSTLFDHGILDTNTGLFAAGQAGMSFCQPVRNEFQRYAGHPATTSLSVVFRKPGTTQGLLSSEELYAVAPRLSGGGSKGGTARLLSDRDEPLPIKTNRLYASVDEFLLSQTYSASKRVPTDIMLHKALPTEPQVTLPPATVEKMRFFLTAHSRAPELNLFGRPRVTIWPVNVDPKLRNASDNLIAFCSTLGPATTSNTSIPIKQFLFSRKLPYSPTYDGQILRNTQIFKYLQQVTSLPIPGFGPTFVSKYGADDRDEILTEIFDYIRCVNLRDTTHDLLIQSTYPASQVTAQEEKYRYAPRGIVVPIRIGSSYGFGRFPTISEAALVFYHAGYVSTPDPVTGKTFAYYDWTKTAPRANGGFGVSQNLMRAFLLLETYNPMQGFAPVSSPSSADIAANNIIVHEITGLNQFSVQSPSMSGPAGLGMPADAINHITLSSGSTWNGQNSGGQEGFMHTLWPKCGRVPGRDPGGSSDPKTAAIPANSEYYPFQSPGPGVAIPVDDKTFNFSGGTVTLKINFGTGDATGASDPNNVPPYTVRTLTLNFTPGRNWPVPTDDQWTDSGNFFTHLDDGGLDQVHLPPAGTTYATLGDYSPYSFATRLAWSIRQSNDPWNSVNGGDDKHYGNRWRQIVQPGDTVRSLLLQDPGDLRVACLVDSGPGSAAFAPHPDYNSAGVLQAQELRCANGAVYYNGTSVLGRKLITNFGSLVATGNSYPPQIGAKLPPTTKGAMMAGNLPADFDTGIGNLADGAFCGKADEGNLAYRYWDTNQGKWIYVYPYFTWVYQDTFDTFFTPNRQVPSPVVFGSLLAGKTKQWQTLCFCPNPAAGPNHPGLRNLPDHLLLDLFTMPIVEPYAISEPFSTAGKINLNYPIMPFSHIVRTTGVRAALYPLRIPAIPPADVNIYKTGNVATSHNYRLQMDQNARDQTIAALDASIATRTAGTPGVFRSASQICERYLYPKGINFSGTDRAAQTFWNTQTLTGDNLREKPYEDLYPRLTTKSNTYTVYVRVQALRNSRHGNAASYLKWTDAKDSVASEYRGYSVIERYIDPSDRRFDNSNPITQARGDYIDVDTQSLENAYRFRVVESKQFNP